MDPLSRVVILAALLSGCVTIAAGDGSRAADPHVFLRGLPAPLVIAHRGGAALWPENTVLAFRAAAALGADILELDLHVSADDVLVVIHDATVDRTTNGHGPVRALTLAELQRLDAGYDWSPDGSSHPYRGRGLVIPTFDETLAALPGARLSVEIKPVAAAFAHTVCRSIVAAGATERVMVASFAAEAMTTFRRACPTVATGATPTEAAQFAQTTALPFVPSTQVPAIALQLPERYRGVPVLRRAVVVAAHAQGVQVHAWTINSERDMRRFLDMGVDGIITDRPDTLLVLLGRRRSS